MKPEQPSARTRTWRLIDGQRYIAIRTWNRQFRNFDIRRREVGAHFAVDRVGHRARFGRIVADSAVAFGLVGIKGADSFGIYFVDEGHGVIPCSSTTSGQSGEDYTVILMVIPPKGAAKVRF